jgi:hypothetical protein
LNLARCEIRRACLPPDQQPEAAESQPICRQPPVNSGFIADEFVFRHKHAPDKHFYRLGKETGLSSSVPYQNIRCAVDLSRTKPYCIGLC